MNAEELHRLETMVKVYFDADEYDEEDIIHLLTDLRHLCKLREWNFGSISHRSNEFYQAEAR